MSAASANAKPMAMPPASASAKPTSITMPDPGTVSGARLAQSHHSAAARATIATAAQSSRQGLRQNCSAANKVMQAAPAPIG